MQNNLAPYACDPARSRGRRHAQAAAPTRNDFQRDRDRIVHCTAFRRLVYKTQVFLNHEGDLFRTRLTHSLEVAQLGRSVARTLGLHEDLVEAIALAHDLGHTPFGHAGQDALNDCMADFGGFEHNLQSLRVVDVLEERYPDFDGLNLCFETREGILKHCSPRAARDLAAQGFADVAQRFLDGGQPSLEAQLCNLADEIAYNAHDIDDGVRSGLLSLDQLQDLPLFAQHMQAAQQDHPRLRPDDGRRLLYETIRRMLTAQIYDLTDATRAALHAAQPLPDVDAVRRAPPLLRFSEAMRAQSQALKRHLHEKLYRHPQVVDSMARAQQVVRDLFAAYMNDAQALPPARSQRLLQTGARPGDASWARAVADYIAGMTDRFAAREHQRLTGQTLF
ncbi:MAG: deoxyguanosinetriphosphate triphosphohydrolase [Rhodoferax sp.]